MTRAAVASRADVVVEILFKARAPVARELFSQLSVAMQESPACIHQAHGRCQRERAQKESDYQRGYRCHRDRRLSSALQAMNPRPLP